MRKRVARWALIPTTGLLLVGVTACGSQTANNSTSQTGSATAKKVTVTVWSWTPVTTTMQQVVTAIEAKYPNIQIKATIEPHSDYNTALQAAASSGSLPDIIGLPPGSQTQEYRSDLQPLNSIAAQLWGASWQSKFPKAAIFQAQLGNPAGNTNFYMLPQETQVINVWYNKKIFSQVGIASPPTDFTQLISDAHKIQAAGYIPFYQGAAQTNFDTWVFMQLAAQTNLTALEQAAVGKPTWTQPGMVQAAAAWKQLFTQHVFQAGALGDQQYPTGANLFAAGRVGMMSLGSWWLQETKLPGVPQGLATMSDYGNFFFPSIQPGGKVSPPLGGIDFGWGLTNTANSSPAVQKASEEVLQEMISGVGEQISLNNLNDLPAFAGFKPTVPINANVAALYNQYMQELPKASNHNIGNPTIAQALDSNLQAVAAGQESPQTAMQKVQTVAIAQAGQ